MVTAVHVLRAKRGGWYVTAKAANGETVATSEVYTTRWGARRAARRLFPDVPVLVDP